jgi:hypothetical protein
MIYTTVAVKLLYLAIRNAGMHWRRERDESAGDRNSRDRR